ncbi:hypothetical protein NMG60_11008075 [Bertholletia excelsa]
MAPRRTSRKRIPPAFVRHFNGSIPKWATVEDLNGKLWSVKMEKTGDGVFLGSGWETFASDMSLELGDFLVFKYNGKSLFNVKIFGTSGCMKQEALANTFMSKETVTPVQIKGESDEEQTCPKSTSNCKQKFSEIVIRRSKRFEGSCEANRHKSRTASLTAEHLKDVDVSEFSIQSNPYFIVSVLPARVIIPRRKLAQYGIQIMEPEMILHDPSGKTFRVRVTHWKDGQIAFSRGWNDLWKENALSLRDKCIFEFVNLGGKRISREIQVWILRPGAE